MKINLYFPDDCFLDIDINDAIVEASEYYANCGDSPTVVSEASTDKTISKFRIEDSNRWYTFEELVELSCYRIIIVVDIQTI